MTDLFKQYDDFDFGDKHSDIVKNDSDVCTTCANSNLTCDNINGVIVCTDCGQVQDKQVLVPDQMQTGDNMSMRINSMLPLHKLLPLHQFKPKEPDSGDGVTMLKNRCDSVDEYDGIDDSASDCGCSRCSSCGEKDTDIIKLEKKVHDLTIELKKAHDDIAKIKADLVKIINN
jgi:hypothetical protein